MKKTNEELQKDLIRLEQELHEANNSVDFWIGESNAYEKLFRDLENKIECDEVYSFLNNCSIVEKQKLIDFINSI